MKDPRYEVEVSACKMEVQEADELPRLESLINSLFEKGDTVFALDPRQDV